MLFLFDSRFLDLICSCLYFTVSDFLVVQFLPRDALLSAVYAVVVCLSVCLSHSGIVSKRLNLGSRKQRRTIAP